MYLETGIKGPRCPICGELKDMILEPGPQKGAFPVVDKPVGTPALPADVRFALQQNEALHEQLADKIAERLTKPSDPAVPQPPQPAAGPDRSPPASPKGVK